MDIPIFYAPPDAFAADSVRLPPEEAHHAVRVLRLQPAEAVIVVDGLGMAYRGEVVSAGHRQGVLVRFHSRLRRFGEPSLELTLAFGLSTGAKLSWVVEKGTELGVSRFVPIMTKRSKVKLDTPQRARTRARRLRQVALAAVKQCRRSVWPEVSPPVTLPEFLAQTDHKRANLVFHPSVAATSLTKALNAHDQKRAALLVGPESGFDDNEVDLAVSAGFTSVTLGPRILRTETACPVVCALVMEACDELR